MIFMNNDGFGIQMTNDQNLKQIKSLLSMYEMAANTQISQSVSRYAKICTTVS